MNKLIACALLLGLLLLPAISVAAHYPIPPRNYFVDAEGRCIAPDGDGFPTEISGGTVTYWYEKGNVVAMRCSGPLPDWAAIPAHATKFDFGSTGLLCGGKMKDSLTYTANYGAIVVPFPGSDPPGWVDITCRFDTGAQDP
ncbi:MAG: hypothetical protein R2844_17940 [Caldilineales bacterium]